MSDFEKTKAGNALYWANNIFGIIGIDVERITGYKGGCQMPYDKCESCCLAEKCMIHKIRVSIFNAYGELFSDMKLGEGMRIKSRSETETRLCLLVSEIEAIQRATKKSWFVYRDLNEVIERVKKIIEDIQKEEGGES